jgi:hypothetical protein
MWREKSRNYLKKKKRTTLVKPEGKRKVDEG